MTDHTFYFFRQGGKIMTKFEDINSEMIQQRIEFDAKIKKINKPQPRISLAVFECRSCMRIHEVEQNTLISKTYEPSVCAECGGRSFKILREECEYTDIQFLTVGSDLTKKLLKIALHGENESYDKYHVKDNVKLQGTLKMMFDKTYEMVLDCHEIIILNEDTLSEDISTEEEYTRRNDGGYNEWRNAVLERDNVCQLCGGWKRLEAHHLFNYKHYPDLRTDVGNGVTLCQWCHQKFHSYRWKNVTPADLVCYIFENKCNI